MNSLSHIDSKTYICNDCGQKESFLHLRPEMTDEVDAQIYMRFKKRLGKI